MKIKSIGLNLEKPKKYSRKLFICTCECRVYSTSTSLILDRIIVKYEVEPNKVLSTIKLKKTQWGNNHYWGQFKQVIELPSIFSKLDESDFIIETGFFKRDGVQMPFIHEISISNAQKYFLIKNQEDRKQKLSKINLNE